MDWQNKIGKRELDIINRIRDGSTLHLNPVATQAIRQMANLLNAIEEVLHESNLDEIVTPMIERIYEIHD